MYYNEIKIKIRCCIIPKKNCAAFAGCGCYYNFYILLHFSFIFWLLLSFLLKYAIIYVSQFPALLIFPQLLFIICTYFFLYLCDGLCLQQNDDGNGFATERLTSHDSLSAHNFPRPCSGLHCRCEAHAGFLDGVGDSG